MLAPLLVSVWCAAANVATAEMIAVTEAAALPALARARTSIQVVRVDTGQVVFSQNPTLSLSPASVTKIITSVAALRILNPNYRFRTQFLSEKPWNAAGVLDGDLIIRGFGDPTLVSERIVYAVGELYHAGLRHVRGQLVVDDSFFDENVAHPGWDEDDSDRAYQALTSGLSVNFNTLTVRVSPPADPRLRIGRVQIDPATDFALLKADVTQGKRTRIAIDVEPVAGQRRDLVTVKGTVAADETAKGFWRKVDYPTEFAGHVFAAYLSQVGVKVTGSIVRGRAPVSAAERLTIESPPLSEVIGYLNRTSNNFVAEQITKTLGAEVRGAPGSTEKGVSVLTDLMSELGFARDQYVLKNGSGLGDINRLSAAQLTSVLRYAYTQPKIFPDFLASLPASAASGTLGKRMLAVPYAVRAKTGSLSNACSLSGYVMTRSGQMLAFTILVNGFTSMAAVHEAQDRFVQALVAL